MRSRFRSSDTAGVAEEKTLVGTSEELRSPVQSVCSVDKIIALAIRKVHSAKSTIVGVDLPVGRMTMWAP